MKGFLKHRLLLKSCLFGQQYHLTRLLKKALFGVLKHQLQVFWRAAKSTLSYDTQAQPHEIQKGVRAGSGCPTP